jgi:hypothetical protein
LGLGGIKFSGLHARLLLTPASLPEEKEKLWNPSDVDGFVT